MAFQFISIEVSCKRCTCFQARSEIILTLPDLDNASEGKIETTEGSGDHDAQDLFSF